MDHPGPARGSHASVNAYESVADPRALEHLLRSLELANRIAVDTEADSLYHYYEKVCLVQISTDEATFVIDPLALPELGVLGPIMADSGVEKVFHAASYDILCLQRTYGFSFSNIFDTHAAAQLLGYEQLGLNTLLEKLLGVAHSKQRQRDDWSRRPLRPEQLAYAAMDTHHLLSLRDILELQLREKNRLEWAREEFEALAALTHARKEFDPEGFRSIKGSGNLKLHQLAVLRSLYILRERLAMDLDLPPFKVFNNRLLLELACNPPESAAELKNRRAPSYRMARRFAKEICYSIEEGIAQDPSCLIQPPRLSWSPPSDSTKTRLKHLRNWRTRKADELGLHVGVVFPGQLLEQLADTPPADMNSLAEIAGMRRWRTTEFGEEILEILS